MNIDIKRHHLTLITLSPIRLPYRRAAIVEICYWLAAMSQTGRCERGKRLEFSYRC